MTRTRAASALAGIVVLTAAGCAGSSPDTQARATSTATVTATATTEVTVTATPTPSAKPSTATPQAGVNVDLTQQLLDANPREPWRRHVITVKLTEETRAEVRTTILDPRGGTDGSPEAVAAIAICKATADLLKSKGIDTPTVMVRESNNTTFAYVSPNLSPTCVEY